MLNSFFAFGVPAFLLILYIGFGLYRRTSKIPYLGFVLFIIAGFLTAFSLQVIQQAFSELETSNQRLLEKTYGYPLFMLALPFLIGLLLVLLNAYRGYQRLKVTFLITKKKL